MEIRLLWLPSAAPPFVAHCALRRIPYLPYVARLAGIREQLVAVMSAGDAQRRWWRFLPAEYCLDGRRYACSWAPDLGSSGKEPTYSWTATDRMGALNLQ